MLLNSKVMLEQYNIANHEELSDNMMREQETKLEEQDSQLILQAPRKKRARNGRALCLGRIAESAEIVPLIRS